MNPRFLRFVQGLVIITMLISGCNREGSQYVGKWVNTKNSRDVMEITHNGDGYLVSSGSTKIGATFKDGTLQISSGFGSVPLTYVKDSDTLLAPGMFGQSEYKRLKK